MTMTHTWLSEMETQTTEIKAGQTWLIRKGKTIVIDEILTNNGDFSVKAGDTFWMRNGKFWSEEFEHSKDLIKLTS